jgi:beta-phosphoglucomutase
MIKAFIFDLDGVLVDTAKYHFKAWHRLAKSLGIDFTEADNEELKGVSRKESLEKILEWGNKTVSPEKFEDLMVQKNQWYLELMQNMDQNETLEGVREFLDECAQLKLKIALGSASKNAQAILERTKLTKYFDAIIDGTKTTESKPHPQVFLMGAEALDVKPENAVVFEDSIAGIQAAQKGNFKSVGVGSPAVLKGADIFVKGLHEHTASHLINELNL